MIEIGILILSIVLQLLAAVWAVRLIRITHHRTAWILISIALVLMTFRRITTLTRIQITGPAIPIDIFDVTGLILSGCMLAGFVYIRRYLYDTFAAERILSESEQRYRALAQNIPDTAVFLFDREHRYTLAEGPALKQLGFSSERFEGKNIRGFTFPKICNDTLSPMQVSALNGIPTTCEQTFKGKTFSIQCNPVKNINGEIDSGMTMVLDITRRVKAEKDRNTAYELLQHTIDGTAEPVMVIGLDHQVKLMNRTIREQYNNASVPKYCYALLHHRETPCDDSTDPCPLRQVTDSLMPVTVLHDHQTKDGQLRQVEIMASPLLDDHGRLQGIIEASRDITERKRAEEKIRNMALMLDIAPSSITVHDMEGRYLYANQRTFDLHGYSQDEFMALNLHQIDVPESERLIKSRIKKMIERREASFEVTHYKKDGSLLPLQVYSRLTTWGDKQAFFNIGTDITERKRGEQALKESEERFRVIFEKANDAIHIEGENDEILEVNSRMCELMGYSRDELLKMRVKDLQAPEVRQTGNIIKNEFAQHGGTIFEGLNLHRDGRRIPVEISIGVIELSSGKLFVSNVRDITERKHAEEEIRRTALMLDIAPSSITVHDLDGHFLYANKRTFDLHGYSRDEFMALNLHHLDTVESEKLIAPRIQVLLERGESSFEVGHIKKDGSILPLEVYTLMTIWGNKKAILSIGTDITERKQIEAALRESEARYRATTELMSDYSFSARVETEDRILPHWIAGAFEKMTEYTWEEVVQEGGWFSILHPDDLKLDQLDLKTLLKNRSISRELRIITKSGKVRWVQNTVRPVWDDQQGRVIELIGAVRDITERKQAEDKIRESEARYHSLFEDSPIALWENDYSVVRYFLEELRKQGVKDINAYLKDHPQVVKELASQVKVLDVNKASLKLYKARKKEELMQNQTSVFSDKSYDCFREELIKIAAGKTYFEWEGMDQTLNGRRLYINGSCSIAPGHEMDLSKAILSIVDITKRKQVEELLKHHTEELEALSLVSTAMRNAQSRSEICPVILSQVYNVFNGSAAALGTYDPSIDEINIELAIGGWENLTGKRQSVTVGITGKVYSENQPYILNNLIDEEHFEWSTDTSNIPFAACVPLTTNERTIGVIWLGRQTPITDQDLQLLTAIADMAASALQRQALHEDLQAKLIALQEAQAQIIQGEKLAAIGQLTSGIAHELNNPLTSVILYAQMLQRKSASDSVKRDLDKMVKETLRASRIVRGLLDFARQRPPETTSVNINGLIKNTVDFLSYEIRSNKIQITLDLFPGLPVIMADPHQLQQVFINLMNNASQAMSEIHDGGNLWINTEVGLSGYKIKSGDKTPVIRISFRDDGPGVQAENLAKIFDPFFTTKPEGSGTGLGLSICHGIITEHGGNIWVESEEGHGATFFIELPVNLPGRNEITKVEDSSGSKSPENSHILIIDDERNIQEVLKRALKGKGYLVDAVSSADEGLDKIVKVNYSTILCDIRMPGINGFDFYSEVAARNPNLAKRIVLITGGVVDSKIQDLIHDKNILCLTKPFDLDELIMMIKIIENDKANKKEMRIRPPHAQKPSKK